MMFTRLMFTLLVHRPHQTPVTKNRSSSTAPSLVFSRFRSHTNPAMAKGRENRYRLPNCPMLFQGRSGFWIMTASASAFMFCHSWAGMFSEKNRMSPERTLPAK